MTKKPLALLREYIALWNAASPTAYATKPPYEVVPIPGTIWLALLRLAHDAEDCVSDASATPGVPEGGPTALDEYLALSDDMISEALDDTGDGWVRVDSKAWDRFVSAHKALALPPGDPQEAPGVSSVASTPRGPDSPRVLPLFPIGINSTVQSRSGETLEACAKRHGGTLVYAIATSNPPSWHRPGDPDWALADAAPAPLPKPDTDTDAGPGIAHWGPLPLVQVQPDGKVEVRIRSVHGGTRMAPLADSPVFMKHADAAPIIVMRYDVYKARLDRHYRLGMRRGATAPFERALVTLREGRVFAHIDPSGPEVPMENTSALDFVSPRGPAFSVRIMARPAYDDALEDAHLAGREEALGEGAARFADLCISIAEAGVHARAARASDRERGIDR